MIKENQEQNKNQKETAWTKVLTFFMQPTIFIALITGFAVPITVQIVTNKLEEAKIKQQIVTSLMGVVEQGIDVENPAELDKLYLLTTLVEDNDFGLSFPSAKDIINERKELEKAKVDSELEALKEELKINRAAAEQARVEMEKLRTEHDQELEGYAEQVRVLSANDSTLEEKINALQQGNNDLKQRLADANTAMRVAINSENKAEELLQELRTFKKNVVKQEFSLIEGNQTSFQNAIIKLEHVGGLAKNINLTVSVDGGKRSLRHTSVNFDSVVGTRFDDTLYLVYVKPYINKTQADLVAYKLPKDF